MKHWKSLLRETLAECLEDSKPTLQDVVDRAWEKHGSNLTQAKEDLFFSALRSYIKTLLDQMTEDDGDKQLALPGMGFPSVIAVLEQGTTYRYVRAAEATLPELEAGVETRIDNVKAARTKLANYNIGLAQVRPIMKGHPEMTLREAVEIIVAKPHSVRPSFAAATAMSN